MATRRKKAAKRKKVAVRRKLRPKLRLKRRAAPIRRIIRKAFRKQIHKARKVKVARKPRRGREAVKLLENQHIRNLLIELAGEKAPKIAGELVEPMSDEELAGTVKLKLSETRAVLNKLHAAGIAAYARTRNNEGWYTYTWGLELTRAKRILDERSAKEKADVQARLSDVCEYYACPRCFERTKARLKFEQAVEAEFKCPECLGMLQYVDAKK